MLHETRRLHKAMADLCDLVLPLSRVTFSVPARQFVAAVSSWLGHRLQMPEPRFLPTIAGA